MRTLNTAKNLSSSLFISFIVLMMGFFTRKLFVDSIGIEYLGLNGLLQNILGAITLLEGGFGASITFQLYRPLAEGNKKAIIALIQFYKKVYLIIAGGVFLACLALYPFLDVFMKDAESLHYISVVYFIFVFNSIIQYFTAYKWSLINADQKAYKLTRINLYYQIGVSLAKMTIIYFTGNYILYLLVESACTLLLNLGTVRTANRLYPYICTKKEIILDPKIKKNIVTNVKAIFLHSLGGYFMHSTSNIVISSFISVAVVGLYSNYTMITGIISSQAGQILNSMSESVANLIATGTSDKIYSVFKEALFLNYLIFSSCAIILYNTLTPFITWWLGNEYLLGPITLALIVFNFFIVGIRSASMMFKIKSGIFTQDRYTPLLQGVINLCLSIWFVDLWGINGVLLAFGLSILAIGFWQFPRLIYKYTFHRPLLSYFKILALYSSSGICILLVSRIIISFVNLPPLLQTCVNAVISLALFCSISWICFRRFSEFTAIQQHIRVLFKRS